MSHPRLPAAVLRAVAVTALAGGALLAPAAGAFADAPAPPAPASPAGAHTTPEGTGTAPSRTPEGHAHGLREAGSPALLAAGGAMAAAGAAGLGFAVRRHGRTGG
ncbi:hypothetical protein [Streptomyces sp. CC224B]|uniref:hypothetical protein n=1 Tax=Streptomyces sp. CC224B TaxID=3044571 RepID=UPI0024A98C7F|nr:hypothetical protein [Streptomyces sp. CC224B]